MAPVPQLQPQKHCTRRKVYGYYRPRIWFYSAATFVVNSMFFKPQILVRMGHRTLLRVANMYNIQSEHKVCYIIKYYTSCQLHVSATLWRCTVTWTSNITPGWEKLRLWEILRLKMLTESYKISRASCLCGFSFWHRRFCAYSYVVQDALVYV